MSLLCTKILYAELQKVIQYFVERNWIKKRFHLLGFVFVFFYNGSVHQTSIRI